MSYCARKMLQLSKFMMIMFFLLMITVSSYNTDKKQNVLNNIDNNISCEFKSLGVIDSEKNMDGIGVQYEKKIYYINLYNNYIFFNSIFLYGIWKNKERTKRSYRFSW